MRRLLLSILCVFPLGLYAANTLSLSAVSGHPGDTLTVTATLDNTDAVAALQAVIPLGSHLGYLDGSFELSSARSNSHASIVASVKDTLRITVFSASNNAFVGTSGDLFSFRIVLGNEPASYPLNPEMTLSDSQAQPLSVTASAGSVTLLSPKIQVVTKTLDYGHIPIRATYSQTLSVSNVGNEPLHITNMEFSATEFSTAQTAFTIPAGATENMVISYAPTQRGAISETVRLRSDAVNDANVYGANLAVLNADPFSVNELHVQPASGISDDTVTVTLRMNNMETDLTGVQVAFKLPKQLEYISSSLVPLERAQSLNPISTMANDTLMLMLFPTGSAAISGEDGDVLSFRLRLNGKSGSYALRPINTILSNSQGDNMVSAVYNANVTIQSPTISANASLAFNSIPVTMRDTMAYAISNTGQVPLTIDKVTFLQERFRVITPLPLVIARNVTSSLEIEYTPTVEGAISTLMQVYSNDPTARMKSVSVTAQVFEPNYLTVIGEQKEDNGYFLSVVMDNYTPIAGLQFDVLCPEGVTPQPFAPSERLHGLSSVTQPIGSKTWRVLIYSISGATITAGDGSIGSIRLSPNDMSAHSGEIIYFSDIILSDVGSRNRFAGENPSCTISYVPVGDVNGDGLVNAMDATALIAAYLKGKAGELPFAVADVNHDGKINVMDATEIINMYLHNR